jgi:hypothetical protein
LKGRRRAGPAPDSAVQGRDDRVKLIGSWPAEMTRQTSKALSAREIKLGCSAGLQNARMAKAQFEPINAVSTGCPPAVDPMDRAVPHQRAAKCNRT